MTTADRKDRLYRFDPLDRSGVFLGLGVVQCALLGGGLVVCVAALTAGAPVWAAAVPVLAGAGASFARVGGYAAWEWIPLGVSWLLTRLVRGRRWLAPLPLMVADGEASAPPLPPCLSGLEILPVPWRASVTFGALRDRQAHTLTALVPASGPEFVTQPRAEQEQLLAGWADVLAQFAPEGSPVTHLGWSDLARQAGLRQHVEWLDGTARGIPNQAAQDSYRQLLEGAATQASSHEVVLFVTVARDQLGRRSQAGDPDAALARALCSTVEALLRSLRNAGLAATDPLSPADLRRLLRTRIDPFAAGPRHGAGRLVERLGLVAPGAEGPMALDSDWRHVHIDGAWHRTYWVVGFPRLPQHPGWLEAFLSSGGLCRSVTVYFRPVSAYQSRRRIERDLVKLESDAQTKEEKGRRVDARHNRATQALLDREQELVAGFAEMGYTALVCVSAPTLERLDADCEVAEQLGREAGLELRVIDARQDLAWAASLPLGMAPRHLFT